MMLTSSDTSPLSIGTPPELAYRRLHLPEPMLAGDALVLARAAPRGMQAMRAVLLRRAQEEQVRAAVPGQRQR